MLTRFVVSDTCDRSCRAQTSVQARCFVAVSVSTITSFFGFSMGIDSSRSVPRLEQGRAQFDWGAPPGCAPRVKWNRRRNCNAAAVGAAVVLKFRV